MYWYVCKYEQTGNMVVLPDFYVHELIASVYGNEITILKSFKKANNALDYLTGLSMAEHLINKTLAE